MKTECNIARDLMPLCIDGAAAEESVRYVNDHVAACDPCAAYYGRMKAELPAENAAEADREQQTFDLAAQKLHKAQLWRVRRNVLLGVLLGALLLLGLRVGYLYLAVDHHAYVPQSEYALRLSQLSDGRVVITADFHDSKRRYGISASTVFAWTDAAHDGETVLSDGTSYSGKLCLSLSTTIIPTYNASANADAPVRVLSAKELASLSSIYGTSYDALSSSADSASSSLVWTRDMDIPPASAEMEAYYQLATAIDRFQVETELKHLNESLASGSYSGDGASSLSDEENAELDRMHAELEAIRATVPEWQTGGDEFQPFSTVTPEPAAAVTEAPSQAP